MDANCVLTISNCYNMFLFTGPDSLTYLSADLLTYLMVDKVAQGLSTTALCNQLATRKEDDNLTPSPSHCRQKWKQMKANYVTRT